MYTCARVRIYIYILHTYIHIYLHLSAGRVGYVGVCARVSVYVPRGAAAVDMAREQCPIYIRGRLRRCRGREYAAVVIAMRKIRTLIGGPRFRRDDHSNSLYYCICNIYKRVSVSAALRV